MKYARIWLFFLAAFCSAALAILFLKARPEPVILCFVGANLAVVAGSIRKRTKRTTGVVGPQF
jgi:hypothetical protein